MEASFPECVFVLSLKLPHSRRRRLFFVRPILHDLLTKPTKAKKHTRFAWFLIEWRDCTLLAWGLKMEDVYRV